MRKFFLYTFTLLLFFFLGIIFNYTYMTYYPMTTKNIDKVINEIKVEETVIEDAIERVYDAVVVVESLNNNNRIANGTGFVYDIDDKNGYIITNHHVISEGNSTFITLSNGERVEATLLGSDVYADIAVLSVPKESVIKVASIGTSEESKVGNTVFAIGAPVSIEYSGTVTRGIISGKERLVAISLAGTASNDWLMRVIQTDAAINPGNSGGPLVNIAGEVIGINSLKLIDSKIEGIGFAIPIEDAMIYVEKLEQGEVISRPILGVQLLDVTDTYALFYSNISLADKIISGAVIQAVVKDSSAAKAGLQKGDVIIKIEKKEIKNRAELRYELYKHDVGSTIKLTYYRGEELKETQVTLVGTEE